MEGGEIEVRAEELPSGGRRIVSVGRVVVERSALLAARVEVVGDGGPVRRRLRGRQRDAVSVTFRVTARSFLTSFTGTVSPIFCFSSAVTRSS